MNKRGNIGTWLLFFIALILVGVALFSFSTFENGLSARKLYFSVLINQIDFATAYNEYIFNEIAREAFVGTDDFDEEKFREEFERVAKERDLNDGIADNLFEKIEKGDYLVNDREIVVRGVVVRAETSANYLKREFDLKREF